MSEIVIHPISLHFEHTDSYYIEMGLKNKSCGILDVQTGLKSGVGVTYE